MYVVYCHNHLGCAIVRSCIFRIFLYILLLFYCTQWNYITLYHQKKGIEQRGTPKERRLYQRYS